MLKSKALAVFVGLIIMMIPMNVFASEVKTLADDEFFTIDYNPANTYDNLVVKISYKVSSTSSGRYYASITDYDCTAVSDAYGTLHFFRVDTCIISGKTSSGYTTVLKGYYERYNPATGLMYTTDLLTYSFYRSY